MDLAERLIRKFSDKIDDLVFFSEESNYRFYIKPKTEEVVSDLRRQTEIFLKECDISADCYFVSNIPYVKGAPDINKLKNLPLINQDLIASFKKNKNLLQYKLSIEDSRPVAYLNSVEHYLKEKEHFIDQNENNDTSCHKSLFQASKKLSLIEGSTLPRAHYQKNFQNILFKTAKHHSKKFIKYIKSGDEVDDVTYEELLKQAHLILQIITQKGFRQKDIIILHLESSIEFIKIFWACMLGGIVVLPIVPAKTVDASDATIKNLFYLESELGKLNIFAERSFLKSLSKHQNTLNFSGIVIEDLFDIKSHKEVELPKIEPNSHSIILMTSGSTGKPKLVLHTHASLIARSIATIEHNHFSSSDITLNWFGFDHVGALVMFHIRDVVLGASQIHVKTNHILEDPIKWIDYLSQYKVTVTWAPNFAYALILEKLANIERRIDFDLSSMRFILNGGESINFDVANDFLEALSQYNLKKSTMHPAWGMSETASGVVYADYLTNVKNFDGVSYTSIGTPIPGCELRIVNGKNNIVPMGCSGKLQIRGLSVMCGYVQDISRNRSSFTEDGWFDTGDLAAITEHGLCIVGREKDILIINGKNYSCANLENEIRQIDGIVSDCICLLPLFNKRTKTDEMVLFISINSSADVEEIISSARQRLITETSLSPLSIIIIPVDKFPKTSIGKIKKSSLKQSYLLGEFSEATRLYDNLYAKDKFIKDWFYEPCWLEKKINFNQIPLDQILVVTKNITGTNQILLDKVNKYPELKIVSLSDFFACTQIGSYKGLVLIDNTDDSDYNANFPIKDHISHLYNLAFHLNQNAHALKVINYVKITDVDINHADADYVGSVTNAFFKSFISEKRNIHFSSIYVARRILNDEINTSRTFRQLFSFLPEEKIYFDEKKCYVSRLNKLEFNKFNLEIPIFSNNYFYVITGGLGGIGYELAKYLIRQGICNIILIGRRENRSIKNFDLLMSDLIVDNGNIKYLSVDICNNKDLIKCINEYADEVKLPLGKILHTAGQFHTRSIMEEEIDLVAKLINPKILGTLNLIEVCKKFKGSELINFSSVNGYFGGAFVSAYAIANAFQDAMAYARGCVRTFSWSMWKKVGMSKDVDFAELTENKGFELLSLQQGMASLIGCMRLNKKHVLVGLNKANRNIAKCINNEIYALEGLISDGKIAEEDEKYFSDKHGVKISIAYSPQKNKTRSTINYDLDKLNQIREIWKKILKIEDVKDDENFFDLGGHSLLLPELQLFYKQKLGIDVKPVDIFKYPTIQLFSENIVFKESIVSFNQIVDSVRKIWEDKLSLEYLNMTDNFFDLGAHSLMIPEVQKGLSSTFDIPLTIVDIFKHPNVESLAAYIYSQKKHKVQKDVDKSSTDRLAQKRKSLLRHQHAKEVEVVKS